MPPSNQPEAADLSIKSATSSPYSSLSFFDSENRLKTKKTPGSGLPSRLVELMKRLLHLPISLGHFVIDWLKVYEPRWRTILAVIVLFAILSSLFFVSSSLTRAATYTFSQTTWSGGQSATNAAHPADQTTWDKYSAQTNIDFGTAGAIKTSASSTNFTETFGTVNTYTDDFATDPYTPARWVNEGNGAAWDSTNLELDITDDPQTYIRYTANNPGSLEHEAQVTAISGTGRLVGPAVRFDNTGVNEAYGMVLEGIAVNVYRWRDGTSTTLSAGTLLSGVTQTSGNFYTMRMAASGTAGNQVVLSFWAQDHGSTKPSDPGWIGVDASPVATYTDTAASGTRLDGSQHAQVGIGGRGDTTVYDDRHDYFKVRPISERTPAYKDVANTTAAINEPGLANVVQVVQNSTAVSQATVAATLTSTTGGNMIVVGALASGSLTVSSVTDNIGNTYTQATNAALTSGGLTTDFWYDLNAVGGVTTVTVTFSAADTSTKGAVVWEVSGLNSVAFDLAASTSGTAASTFANGASVTTTGSRGFVAALNYSAGTFSATGPAFSANNEFTAPGTRTASNAASAIALISTSAAAHQPVWILTNGTAFTASTAAFKETTNASVTTLWDGSGQLSALHGQVALDATTNLRVSSAATSADLTSLTIGTGSNRALVVALHFAFGTSGVTNTAVTWDPSGTNQPLTRITTRDQGADGGLTELWGLVNPTSGNKTLSATWTTAVTAVISAASWTGVDQSGGTTSFPNSTTGIGSGNSHSLTITSALGNMTMYAVSCNQAFVGLSKPRIFMPNSVANLGISATTWAPGAATVTHGLASGTCGSTQIGTDIKAASITSSTQSLTIDSTSANIQTATLTKNDTPGSGTVTYYLSNNGGTNWGQVTPGSAYNFSTTASDLRFKVSLTSGASVQDVTVAYSVYSTTADLTSNAYNTADNNNIVTKLAWTASGVAGAATLKFQIRSAPDSGGSPGTWSSWCGYSDCSGSTYFETADNNVTLDSAHALRSGANDRWFQYKIFFGSDGSATATVNDLTITYVVNAPPNFDPDYPTAAAGGTSSSQVTDSASADYGKVLINYRIRDTDTDTGTANPGFVTPSFQYNIGGGWVSITSGYLGSTDLNNKPVDDVNYTTYTATWNAQSQIPTNYLTTAQVRVTINDNEGANNTATATSANFTLDTKVPTVSVFTMNSSTDTYTLTASDDTNLSYRVSNNSDLTADGVNGTSGSWQAAGGNSINISPSWTFAGSPNEQVYAQVRDTAGNLTAVSAKAPIAVTNMDIKDISNEEASVFREFVSWTPYSSVANATFANYKVYRSTDGSSFSLVSTITDINLNYFADLSLSSSNTYYYKVIITDSDGDISNWSTTVQDQPNGQGGTDTTPPTITSVTVAETQATYARITWTTDELSDSRVDYSIAPSTAFGSGQTNSSFVTSHNITITGLTPNTNYLFRVRSIDIIGNTGTNNNGGAGFALNTSGGPIISNVTETSINDNSASITWNTNTDSDSHVTYSTSPTLATPTTVGSNALVGGTNPFQHNVNITGLVAGTRYYYSVSSKDAANNTSQDTNGNNYYSFTTTTDTVAPVISNVATPVVAPTAGVVIWQTNELASTQLNWGAVAGSLTNTTTLDTTLSIFHVVSLTGLSENTRYYYQVRSKDAANNETISAENNFLTGATTIVQMAGSGASGSTVVLDTTPPQISEIKSSSITAFAAVVTFTANEDSLGIVQYGKDKDNLDRNTASDAYRQSHSINLTGLTMGTPYFFKVKAIDKAGNSAESDVQTFTTQFFTESSITLDDAEAFQREIEAAIENALPSLVPPFIERPQATLITDSSALITWRTNVKTFSVVNYASEEAYDTTKENPYATEISDVTQKVTDHALLLENLNPNTRYHFKAKSFNLPQLIGQSADLTFVTKALDIRAQITDVGNDSFRVIWRTNDPTSSFVEYRNVRTGELSQKSVQGQSTYHEILVDGLTPATTYEVSVFGFNDKGNRVQTTTAVRVTTSQDVAPPQILSLKIDTAVVPGVNDRTQTIISWKTDEPSTSIVYYEEGAGIGGADAQKELTNKVAITNSFVLDHAVVLSVLKPGGLYRIQVGSTDLAGNNTILPIKTIVVPRQSESILDVIFKNFEDTFKFLRQVGR